MTSRDRLHAAWRLSLYGLRRGEVLGLRWSDIELTAKTLTVSQARVLVEYKVRLEGPKSRNGHRTLPLDDVLVEAPSPPCASTSSPTARQQAVFIRPDSPASTGTKAAST